MAKTLTQRVTQLEEQQVSCQKHMTGEISSFRKWMSNGFTKDVSRVLAEPLEEFGKEISYIKGKIDGMSGNGSPKKVFFRKVIETTISIAVIGGILGLLAMFFLGRLTAEDVANILRAWHGG